MFDKPEIPRFVVLRFVVVPLVPVKFWRVVEPFTSRLERVAKVEASEPMIPVFDLIAVVEARPETKRLVEVLFVVVELSKVTPPTTSSLEREEVDVKPIST